MVPVPNNSHPSDGGEETDSVGMVPVSTAEDWKEDESGANTMLSV
jgi:hypothetical protein